MADIIRGTGGSLAGEVSDVKRGLHVTDAAATPFINPTDPSATDDASKGYIVGMRWINSVTEALFSLIDATTGAAKWLELAAGAVAKHVVYLANANADYQGAYRVRTLGATAKFSFSFHIPDDFNSLIELQVFGAPNASYTGTGEIDLLSAYGKVEESVLAHTESQSLTGLTGVIDQWDALDISGVFNSITAGDNCGVEVDHVTGIGTVVNYFGVHLEYL